MVSWRLSTVSPMSSAKALKVEEEGRFLVSLSMRMSMHSTKRVGDIGHPCLTPDRSVMEGRSSDPILS